MVDAFIDPLDMAPITPGKSSYSNLQKIPSANKGPQRSFQEILINQVQQEPTPVMMPEDLLPPKITDSLQVNDVEVDKEQNIDKAKVKSDLFVPELNFNQDFAAQIGLQVHDDTVNLGSMNVEQAVVDNNVSDITELPAQPEVSKTTEGLIEDETVIDTQKVDQLEEIDDEPDSVVKLQNYNTEYTIQRGDTLSEIIANALKEKGEPYRNSDIYRLVDIVAKENGLENPNQIYYGDKIDLSAVYADVTPPQNDQPEKISLNSLQNQSTIKNKLQVPAQGIITSEFGLRTHPIHNDLRQHNGVDIAMDAGTPIRPIKEGNVTFAGEHGGYGNMVEIEHVDGSKSRYAHLSEIHVEKGVEVKPNDLIGLSGNTGLSTGPHLHFEIRKDGKAIDPLTVLSVHEIETHKSNVLLAQAKW